MKRNLKIKSSAVKYHAYKAFVRPKLEYASAVWDPHTRTQINQIEKVQRRAARYVTNRYHNTSSVTDMLQNLNWPSLEIRRTRIRLIMFYKIIHHVVAIHPLDTLLLPTTTITRYNIIIVIYQHIRTDKDSYKYSFYPRTIIQWNLLPIHVHEAVTVDAFKALVPVTVLAPSYLYNRQQYVNINDHESDMANVVCGVPQGSILGPKLFILYINDICNTSSLLKFILFADDTTIFWSGRDLTELSKHMSKELVKLSIWFAINKLSLN